MRTSILEITLLSSTATSIWKLNQATTFHLLELKKLAGKAALLNEQSIQDQHLATDAREAAQKAKNEALAFEAQAAKYMEQAEEHETHSLEYRTQAQALQEKSDTEAFESGEYLDEAAVQIGIADSNQAEATKDAALISELEGKEVGVTLGVGLCETIPLLDIVCSVIGGASDLGLEATLTEETVAVTGLLAAESVAKNKAAEDTATAEEFHVTSIVDADSSKELEEKALSEEEIASNLKGKGERAEEQARTKVDENEIEMTKTNAEVAKASSEEIESDNMLKRSIENGMKGAIYSLTAIVMSTISGAYVILKYSASAAMQISTLPRSCFSYNSPRVCYLLNPTQGITSCFLKKWLNWFIRLSRAGAHLSIIFISLRWNETMWESFETFSLSLKGEVILHCSCQVTLLEVISFYLCPFLVNIVFNTVDNSAALSRSIFYEEKRDRAMTACVVPVVDLFARMFLHIFMASISHFIIYIFEILILLINFGPDSLTDASSVKGLWLAFVVGFAAVNVNIVLDEIEKKGLKDIIRKKESETTSLLKQESSLYHSVLNGDVKDGSLDGSFYNPAHKIICEEYSKFRTLQRGVCFTYDMLVASFLFQSFKSNYIGFRNVLWAVIQNKYK